MELNNIKNPIEPNHSEFCEKIGFTPERFVSYSYLWKEGEDVYINFVESVIKRKGFFSDLIKNINQVGLNVKVTTPFAVMQYILSHKGFEKTFEFSEDFGEDIEVWIKKCE